MIDLLSILNAANSIGSSISTFYSYLTKRSQTNNIHKKLVFREIRDNLKRLQNRNKRNLKMDQLILSLKNEAYTNAILNGFDLNSLATNKQTVVTESILIKKRNSRYLGWNCERLLDSVDAKIVELKDLVSYYDSLDQSTNNFTLKLNNLYYQILLLVILINQRKK